MKRISISLEDYQDKILETIAHEYMMSKAQVLRLVIDRELKPIAEDINKKEKKILADVTRFFRRKRK